MSPESRAELHETKILFENSVNEYWRDEHFLKNHIKLS